MADIENLRNGKRAEKSKKKLLLAVLSKIIKFYDQQEQAKL